MQEDLSGLGLSYIHKLSVLRLAVDLIKADNQIFGEEVKALTRIHQQFGLSQQDIDGIHYITLQQAVEALKDLDVEAIEMIISLLKDIMCADNDIDYDENILMTSVKMSIAQTSKSWCNVISATNVMDETSQKQIMYLEDAPSEAVHKVFDDKYDRLLITKAFNDLGLDFFYLPDAISGMNPPAGLGSTDNAYLLKQAMKYLVPSAVVSSDALQEAFDPYDFFHFLMSRYNMSPDVIKSHSFLMLKIRDSYYLDDENNLARAVDFFVMDISEDVKNRIYSFVSDFDTKSNQISYEGCYKILCDYLSTESNNVSHVVLDAKLEFHLKDSVRTPIVFESSPQARTFYLLLLWYGENGVAQSLFEDALGSLSQMNRNDYLSDEAGVFDMNRFLNALLDEKTEVARLIYNTIVIYSEISTKDSENVKFLDYISRIFHYRSALKHYINNGFSDAGKLSDISSFSVMFDPQLKVYRLPVKFSRFVMETQGGLEALSEGELWKSLI